MQDLLLEILVYLIFLYLILSVSYGARDPHVYYMRSNVENIFVKTSSTTCPAFEKAVLESHLWCWAREVLVPSLLDTRLYTGERRPQDMCGTIADQVTFLLGHAIFRQIRIRPGSPNRHPATHENKEDDRDFGFGWNETAPTESHFDYMSAFKIHGFPYEGTIDTYGGGGYLVELKGPMSQAERTVDEMEAEGWIDKYTKAIFTEFAVYNPQVNLFAAVMFIFEFLPSGGLVTKFEFQGLTLLRYHRPGGFYVLVSEIGYILFTIFYTRREYKAYKKAGRAYFKSVWTFMEICVLLLSYAAIVLYLLKTSLTYYTLDKFIATKGKKYVRIQPLAFLDSTLVYVISFQVFIGNIKLLKLLKFNKRIGMLSSTLRYAAPDVLGFGLLFVITLAGFVSVFFLNTHTTVMEFSTFVKAAESSFFLINKKFDDIANAAPVLGPVFYFVFAFILYWVVFQLLIAIICEAFAQVSKDLNLQANDYEVIEYLTTRLAAYLSALRPNAVRAANIPPPKPPDVDSLLRHLDQSLDRTLEALDQATPKALPEEAEAQGGGKKIPAGEARIQERACTPLPEGTRAHGRIGDAIRVE
ncbi:polycystin-2-like protein 1 [Penaeus indicus]|uniref:polycystin-2-like protein 1 n=1 Tax=Penaeus indicus TaxID=29960 RepID=UPI00300CB7E9